MGPILVPTPQRPHHPNPSRKNKDLLPTINPPLAPEIKGREHTLNLLSRRSHIPISANANHRTHPTIHFFSHQLSAQTIREASKRYNIPREDCLAPHLACPLSQTPLQPPPSPNPLNNPHQPPTHQPTSPNAPDPTPSPPTSPRTSPNRASHNPHAQASSTPPQPS